MFSIVAAPTYIPTNSVGGGTDYFRSCYFNNNMSCEFEAPVLQILKK